MRPEHGDAAVPDAGRHSAQRPVRGPGGAGDVLRGESLLVGGGCPHGRGEGEVRQPDQVRGRHARVHRRQEVRTGWRVARLVASLCKNILYSNILATKK